jgi:hypothetical protein
MSSLETVFSGSLTVTFFALPRVLGDHRNSAYMDVFGSLPLREPFESVSDGLSFVVRDLRNTEFGESFNGMEIS